MIQRLFRSVPSRRMSVRTPKALAPKPTTHKSFRLTKPEKSKFIQSGFGAYTPQAFKEQLKHADPKTAASKEEAFFLKHAQSEKTLTTKEDIKKFSKGFLEEAHETGAKLRTGFNIRRSGSEQAQRLVQEYETKSTPTETPKQSDRREDRQRLNAMRERLGIQHGSNTPVTPAGIQEPTPLGEAGWSAGKNVPPPAAPAAPDRSTPSLGANALGFAGGRIFQTHDAQSQPTGIATAAAPKVPVITSPPPGAIVTPPFNVTGQAAPGRTVRVYIDEQLETSSVVPIVRPCLGVEGSASRRAYDQEASPTDQAAFSIPITRILPDGEHELLVAEYIDQIRQGLSQPVKFTITQANLLSSPANDLPDMSSIHELPI